LPIWSLTQERVDKLKQQMVNKKEEHDELMQLSEKDLWCEDLDNFVKEWETQLKEDAEYDKDIRNKGRRASRKIGAGRTTKGRVKKEDDDFNPTKSKAASKALQPNINKGITKVEQKPHKGFLEMFQAKPKPKAPSGMGVDGADEAESGLSDDDFAALAPTKPSKETSRAPSRAPSEQPSQANGRTKRAAAAAPKQWVIEDDDESESDDGKFLGDVGDMVKGIGGKTVDGDAANARLSLFAMSRPGTSHGDRPTSSSGLPKHTLKTKASKVFEFSDGDETNYEMLAKSSPHKAAPAPKDNLDSFLSDDEDLLPITKKVPVKAPAVKTQVAKAPAAKAPVKRNPKAKAAPVEKAAPAPKPTHLSPAAKIYAKKHDKVSTKKSAFSDDEDDEVEMNDSPPPKPAARGRPARAAVVKAKEKKPIYIDSEDEESMQVDEDDSALVDEESEEDDFDESE
jgi:DNA topoisomerase-2